MKKQVFFPFLFSLLVSTSIFTSCNRDTAEPEQVTTQDAADVVEAALAEDTGGTSSDANYAARTANTEVQNLTTYCGLTGDSTIVRNFSHNQATANYNVTASWKVICTGTPLPLPTSLDMDLIEKGTYSTLRVGGTDSTNCDFNLANLFTGNNYLLNGSINRKGNYTSKVRTQNAFGSVLNMTYSNVEIGKTAPYQIQSGTATFTLTATKTGLNPITFTGTVTFLGGQSATVTINGQTFTISL